MFKKVFISSIIFFLIAAGIGVYVVFFRSSSNSPSQSPQANGALPVSPDTTLNAGTSTVNLNTTTTSPGIKQLSTLTQISADPVSGFFVQTSKVGSSTIVRYAERATSHTFNFSLVTGELDRLSITTIPRVYESYWTANGNGLILRYLSNDTDQITSYSAKIASSTGTSTINLLGTFLPTNIESLAISPNTNSIFYTAVGNQGNAIGIRANTDGSKAAQIFSSPLHEWLISWPEASTIALTTKPAAGVEGFLYFLNPTTGALRKVLGGITGFVATVDPTVSQVAYTTDAVNLAIYSIKNDTSIQAQVQTIADKCVWAHNQKNTLYCAVPINISQGNYPDSWYQGQVSFTDNIYRIDTTSGKAELVTDLQNTYHQNIDVINPVLSSNDQYLIFSNKKDYSLWSLKLH